MQIRVVCSCFTGEAFVLKEGMTVIRQEAPVSRLAFVTYESRFLGEALISLAQAFAKNCWDPHGLGRWALRLAQYRHDPRAEKTPRVNHCIKERREQPAHTE